MFAASLQFVSKAYNSANADVRSAAVKVTREVHDIVGPAIR
jgi:centrosomal protein CEP104